MAMCLTAMLLRGCFWAPLAVPIKRRKRWTKSSSPPNERVRACGTCIATLRNVWILGSISPLPRDITWRSKQVESVLESTSQVLVQKPIEISVPRVLWMLIADRKYLMVGGGKKLKDVCRLNFMRASPRSAAP